MISKETIRTLKKAVSIEDVNARCGVALNRSGERLKARCPFADHQDRTSSFFVFPRKQRFLCFGQCGRGGDVLDFLQEWYGCTFLEAVHRLSRGAIKDGAPDGENTLQPPLQHKAGRTLQHFPAILSNKALSVSEHTAILTVTGNIYRRYLLSQPRVLSYTYERGIHPKSVALQCLGYADGYTFPSYTMRSVQLTQDAKRSGLLTNDGRESLLERLVFPEMGEKTICSLLGRCVLPRSSKYTYLGPPISKPRVRYGEAIRRVDTDRPGYRGILILEGAVARIIALPWKLSDYPLELIAAWPSTHQLSEHLSLYERAGGATVCLSLDDDAAWHTATVAVLNALRNHVFSTTAVPRSGREKTWAIWDVFRGGGGIAASLYFYRLYK